MRSDMKTVLGLVAILVLFGAFSFWQRSEIRRFENRDYSKLKIQEAFFNQDCSIAVKVPEETVTVTTSYQETSANCLESQYKTSVSPDHSYFAYPDLSGGVDPQLRVFSIEKSKFPQGEVLFTFGPSVNFDFTFTQNGKLAVLFRENEDSSAFLVVYDVPRLYGDFPNNIDAGSKYFMQTQPYEFRYPINENISGGVWFITASDKPNDLKLLDKNHKEITTMTVK